MKTKSYLKKVDMSNRDADIIKKIREGYSTNEIAHKHGVSASTISRVKRQQLNKAIDIKHGSGLQLADSLAEKLQQQLNEVNEEIEIFKNTFDENGSRNLPIPPQYLNTRLDIIKEIAKLYAVSSRVDRETIDSNSENIQYVINLSASRVKKVEDNTQNEEQIKQQDIAKRVVDEFKDKDGWQQKVEETYKKD